MKIRQGFVSNSSSSSFCIIGVRGGWVNNLATAEGKCYEEEDPEMKVVPGCKCNLSQDKFCPQCGAPKNKEIEVEPEKEPDYLNFGMDSGKIVDFYGSCGYAEYAGIDAETALKNMSIEEARIYFVKLVKDKLNVSIPLSAVDFYYGEVSSE